MLLSARRVARLAPAVRSRALSKVVATITGPCNKEALSTFTRAIDGIGGCKLGGSRSMELSGTVSISSVVFVPEGLDNHEAAAPPRLSHALQCALPPRYVVSVQESGEGNAPQAFARCAPSRGPRRPPLPRIVAECPLFRADPLSLSPSREPAACSPATHSAPHLACTARPPASPPLSLASPPPPPLPSASLPSASLPSSFRRVTVTGAERMGILAELADYAESRSLQVSTMLATTDASRYGADGIEGTDDDEDPIYTATCTLASHSPEEARGHSPRDAPWVRNEIYEFGEKAELTVTFEDLTAQA
ncbi:hypothetical protein EMIHUDRAFT_432610 [Emiliania huxleyi CCMP1516]|uniref:Uncharacterized protein n=2 Tax=Emiliania huxleyi TaxID=2903 RepID=A0A0D3IU19_EMIH1|nr:hypothetical protein EMIHUDRAFT_432610 [Emiliania huxleyi CCMP1516]EOD14754.1 hypothetical protein EMIHUDRAFT_432610 [Emiliania huxleyi CCMP1516]|eukprot:XP_005767183.1 hypothetical protein EMIHUDRAFT_432610 [Emiliania huxleyi CCMP1516]